MLLSLIIPAHNEEHRLLETLQTYTDTLRERYGDEFEILVVANGCTDDTVGVAQKATLMIPQIKVLESQAAIGKGGAVLAGFRYACGHHVVFADADGATTPDSLLSLINQLETHDIVIGSRRLTGSTILQKQPLSRRIFSRLFTLTIWLLFGLPYRDTQCGAKAFRREAAKRLGGMVKEFHWAFDVDLLLYAKALAFRVAEHPVVWCDQPGSKLRVGSTSRQVLQALWRMQRRHIWSNGQSSAPASQHAPGKRPLRILAFNWRCLRHPQAGGAELNLFEQAQQWVKHGHEITIVTAKPESAHIPDYEQTPEGIQIYRRGGRFTVYFFAAVFALRHGWKFDRILDVANGIPFFTPLVSRTPSVLLVHHVHDQQWFSEFCKPVAIVGRFLECKLVPLLYRQRQVIAVSPTTRDALVAAGFASEQIQVVYNGVQKSQHASATVGNGTGVRIAYVGRLKRYKRIDLLLSAVARLRTEFPDIHLDLAGDGDARPQLEALIEQLQLQPHVTVHGFVDEQTKSAILRAATVFATPSMHEGWGLSVIEANAHGCPAVAYDVPGLRVAIRHGETGLLAGTHSAFEQALASILRSPALRERLSAGACKWAGKFSWESTALATLEVLHACGAGQFQSLSTSLSRLLFRPLGKLSKRSIS